MLPARHHPGRRPRGAEPARWWPSSTSATGADLGVQVRVSSVLGQRLAARMFACEEPGRDDLLDAVGELGNIAGGNVKSLLFTARPAACRCRRPCSAATGLAPARERRGRAHRDPRARARRARRADAGAARGGGGLLWPPADAPSEELLEAQS